MAEAPATLATPTASPPVDLPPPELPVAVPRFDDVKPAPVARPVKLPPPDLPIAMPRFDDVKVPPAEVARPIDLPPPDLPVAVPRFDMKPAPAKMAEPIDLKPPQSPPVVVSFPNLAPPPAAVPPPQEPPAAPPPAPAPPDAPIRLAIAALIESGKAPSHPRIQKRLREAIATVYAAREHAPLFVSEAGWTAAARKAIGRLHLAYEDGLDPLAYPVPALPGGGEAERAEALARADMALAVAMVMYARDARGGRIDARRLSNLIDPSNELPEPAEVLAALIAAADAGAALQAYNPRHQGYRRLRAKLAELRGAAVAQVPVAIPFGPVVRLGMSDPRVPLVRQRFGLGPPADATYDEDVARAVADFQRDRGLPATGTLTRQTVAALGQPTGGRLAGDVIANMERWRWLPAELGDRHILVNVPEFTMRVMDRDRAIHEARVIVGKPETQTPIFSDVMQFLVVNPSWFVPPSILKKEFLPKLATDPTYAERRGYVVVRRGNQISIRQPPGERNALGNVKFMFPNRHAVYLHDTPSRSLFGTERRAYSHGCVRIDKPFQFAEILLGRGWSEAAVRSLVGKGERTIKVAERVPIHIVYFTHIVDETGRLQVREDLYGHHRKLRDALGLDG